ncbi:MAG: GGDEF and EAL domain-containing protein [Bacillota bacterium]|nr:GGDEF and EAL domain-containing protein [Bacillota bacterium]
MLKRLIEAAHMGIWKFDLETKMIWLSDEVINFYGLKTGNHRYSYNRIQQLIHSDDKDNVDLALEDLINGKAEYNITYRVISYNNSEERYLHSVAEVEYDFSGNVTSILGIVQDVTERFKYTRDLERKNRELTKLHKIFNDQEQRFMYLAYHDDTTDLPNRNYFLDKLEKTIKRNGGSNLVVVILDLDNFKIINDAFGHVTGDEFLIEISKRLLKSFDGKGTVARISSDEFSLLIENVKLERGIAPLLEPLISVFKEPFSVNETMVHLTASIGVSIYPDDADTEEELLKNAYIAMHQAKELGKNNCQIFHLSMKENLWQRINIELLLLKAIKNNEFVLYYQPQYTVEMGKPKLRGFEALIRWDSPELGLLNPIDFIPIAEQTGLITQIGEWVLKTACNTCKRLEEKYDCDLIMAVNISPIQLWRSEFNEKVIKVIEVTGLKPPSLELEVTESIFIDRFDSVANKLSDLRKLGVGIALDDFGTGYSSLSYLRKLPISLLKVDKSFVQEIDTSVNNELIESIIILVHKLKIKTMAEGVETLEQLNYLINANCDYLQGYYFGKPVPEELIDSTVRTICSF